jgi:hypothetical protein
MGSETNLVTKQVREFPWPVLVDPHRRLGTLSLFLGVGVSRLLVVDGELKANRGRRDGRVNKCDDGAYARYGARGRRRRKWSSQSGSRALVLIDLVSQTMNRGLEQ